MAQAFKNNAHSSLAAELSAVATTATLATGHGARFPAPTGGDYFLATLILLDGNGAETAWEIVKCTARATDVLTIERAQEGTTASIWTVGSRIEARTTAGTLDRLASNLAGVTPGTGIASALAVAVGTAGAPVINGGALGTPASGVATNLTGTAAGLTAGKANGINSATTTVVVDAATAPSAGQVLTASSATAANWETPSGKVAVQRITDTTDIALANRVSSYSTVGSSFSANIPANGAIRLASVVGKFLNDATAALHGLSVGIRISGVNYWFGRYLNNSVVEVTSYATLSATSSAYLSVFGSLTSTTVTSATDPWHPVLDVAGNSIPTGTQTVQLIAGWVTNAVTIKGTNLTTRVLLEFIG